MTFNDTSTAASLLATRRSGKARDMTAPGPDAVTLDAILAAATRVPDHGKLAPWPFIIIDDQHRTALADLLEAAYREEKPAASRMEIEAMRNFGTQAPTLVVLMSRPYPDSHIPLWEQQLSVGAAAMQLLNAAHAHGFVGNWLTGWASFSPAVTRLLGEPGERIAGFFFLGTATRPLEERPRPEPAAVIRRWTPPAA